MKKKKEWYLALSLFIIYMVFLLYFLFFAEIMGRTDAGRGYHYNLVPFKEIGRFIRYRETLGTMAVFLNIEGNVLAFMPFGFFLPKLFKKCHNFWYVALVSMEFSLAVELVQLVSRVGSCDVDDLILNTLGGMAGYGLYRLLRYLRYVMIYRRKNGKKKV